MSLAQLVVLTVASREYDNYLEGEQREMIELYQQKGMSKVNAKEIKY